MSKMQHTPAKRIDSGNYEYRGFEILDHGTGQSLNARINKGGFRWKFSPLYSSENKIRGHAFTLKEAKQKIDAALAKVNK